MYLSSKVNRKWNENQFFSRQNRIDIQLVGKITIENPDFRRDFSSSEQKRKIVGGKLKETVYKKCQSFERSEDKQFQNIWLNYQMIPEVKSDKNYPKKSFFVKEEKF